jgi:anti-sigma B factor antagonist
MARLGGGGGAEASVEISSRDDGAVVIVLTGELDISNTHEARAELRPVLDQPPPSTIIDVSGLEFMDSSGLALLLQYAQQCEDVRLVNPTSVVRRIIQASGLASVLDLDG